MNISLYEFNSLNDFEKGEILWEFGVHLSERFKGETGYSLYQLNNFYVEVTYDRDKNIITKFTSFLTNTKLEPYLDKIDISGIINL